MDMPTNPHPEEPPGNGHSPSDLTLVTADRLKCRLDELRPINAGALASLTAAFDLEMIADSNAIEGNSLTLRETQLVIERGVTIGGKPLKDHLEAINLQAAWQWLQNIVARQTDPVESDMLDLHAIILTRIDDQNAGRYRNHNVRIQGATHIPSNHVKLPPLLADAWGKFARAGDQHPICRYADLHHDISNIHPFADGNGRTARLLLNLGLLRHGFPPAHIPVSDKLAYYQALEAVDKGTDPAAFRRFVVRATCNSLSRYLEALAPGQG